MTTVFASISAVERILGIIGGIVVFEFLYRCGRKLLTPPPFDLEGFKEEAARYINENVLTDVYEDPEVVENACDALMGKFPDVDGIVYEINDDGSKIQFIVFASNMRTFNVEVVPGSK